MDLRSSVRSACVRKSICLRELIFSARREFSDLKEAVRLQPTNSDLIAERDRIQHALDTFHGIDDESDEED